LLIKEGHKIPNIKLSAIDGSQFDSDLLLGKKYLITFFRFATCPFCNTRLAALVNNRDKLGNDFEIIAIFESQIDHLQRHASKHFAKFPILADPARKYYREFNVEKSMLGMFKGMIFRMPTLLKGMLSGYIPREISSRMLIMPLSLLVDKKGVIQSIYQGQDEGDHMPMEQIIKFAS